MKISQLLSITSIVLISILASSCGESGTDKSINLSDENIIIPSVDVMGNTADREIPSDVDINTENYISGLNDFSFSYFTNKTIQAKRENFVFSPISISAALSLVYLGAENNSEQQIKDAFQSELSDLAFFQQANTVDQILQSSDSDEDTKLTIVNSLWAEKTRTLSTEFLDNLSKYFEIGVNTVDFVNSANNVNQKVNDWVNAKTKGNIKNIVPDGVFDSKTVLSIINAVHFKAKWQHTFNADNTELERFTLLDSTSVETLMMKTGFSTGYSQKAGVSVLELPFSTPDWSLFILMPDVNDFESLSESLTADLFEEYIGELERVYVNLSIPKFNIDAPNNIKENLTLLGITDIFDQGKSDLSGIFSGNSTDVFVGSAFHRAVIDFNEQGVEASASTAITLVDTSLPVNIIEVNINSPFIFAIRHNELGVVSFIGETVDPR